MKQMALRRTFILLGVLFLVVAAGAGALFVQAFRPADWYFMPGPLGRVERPMAAGKAEKPKIRDAEIENDHVRTPDLNLSVSASQSFSFSAVGFQTRALSGLDRADEIKWGETNGLTAPFWFMHHLNAVFPPELYEAHPEYFPLNRGKRVKPPANAQFWQPDLGRADVARYAAEQAKRYFDQHPSAESYSLGVDDGLNFGESPETLALLRGATTASGKAVPSAERDSQSNLNSRNADTGGSDRLASGSQNLRAPGIHYFRGRPDFSPLVFTFMNRAAVDLSQTYPNKYLGCLAYYWCENVPPFPVDPHVVPFLTADRSQSYDPTFKREELALQAAWAAALRSGKTEKAKLRKTEIDRLRDRPTGSDTSEFRISASQDIGFSAQGRPRPRLGLYDYLDDQGFLIPRVPIRAFAEHIRHAYDVGFTDYFGELNPNWGLDGPKPWLVTELLQSPEADVDRLLDTYYSAYFQSAAGPMRQFFERCERQWMSQPGPSYWLKHYRNTSQAALFPTPVCHELRALLTQAATQANNDRVRQRVNFVSDAFGLTERFVAFCEARNELTARILRHQLVGPAGDALLGEYAERRRAFIRYGHELERRSPLAFYPINYLDWVRDDPSFAATQEIAAATLESAPGGAAACAERESGGAVARGARPEGQKVGGSEDRRTGQADALNLRASGSQSADAGGRELLENGALAGPVLPGRRIAGLQFGADLPAPWLSKLEPTERGVAALVGGSDLREAQSEGQRIGGAEAREARPEDQRAGGAAARPQNSEGRRVGGPEDKIPDRTEPRSLRHSYLQKTRSRVLRLSAQESAIVFTWAPAMPGKTYAASAWTRAQVSPSDIVELVIGWLDAKEKRIGNPIGIRLPEGTWPDWVQLVQGAKAPNGAAWVGIQLIVQHQVGDDWAEARDFSLREQ